MDEDIFRYEPEETRGTHFVHFSDIGHECEDVEYRLERSKVDRL